VSEFEEIETYAEAHSTPPGEVLHRLGEETSALPDAEMSVGHLEGLFLRFLVAARKPRRVLEIGVFTGWSSIAMASALPENGLLIACDVNEETTAIARRYAEEAGLADRIDYRLGDAKETIAALDGEFDLVFIDAWKDDYVDYYELVLPKLSPNGLILADNTLAALRGNEGIVRFNEHVLADERVECMLLPLRDGVTLIRKV
jgi:caffeoyl-CoA O-methyltransferase